MRGSRFDSGQTVAVIQAKPIKAARHVIGTVVLTLLITSESRAQSQWTVHEWGTFTSLQDEQGEAIGGINTDDEAVNGDQSQRLWEAQKHLSDYVSVPKTYRTYLDLGRFRNALALDEAKRHPTKWSHRVHSNLWSGGKRAGGLHAGPYHRDETVAG